MHCQELKFILAETLLVFCESCKYCIKLYSLLLHETKVLLYKVFLCSVLDIWFIWQPTVDNSWKWMLFFTIMHRRIYTKKINELISLN